MEERKRTIFAIVIACVVLVAVLYSFGMNLFSPRPELNLADPSISASQDPSGETPGEEGGIPVELTPETVQYVVANLPRYASYSRTVTVEYRWGSSESGASTAQVWADGGWIRTDTTLDSGTVEHSVVGNGQLWLWYNDEEQVYHGSASDMTADLMQRTPTYENILEFDTKDILTASYVRHGGQYCIFVEARQEELDYVYRYWVSVSSGLLVASETESDGEIVYLMSSRDMVSPLTGAEGYFTLPDGTDLLQSPQDQEAA